MPEDIEQALELDLRSLLEKLDPEELYDIIHTLAKLVWKKGRTIEIIGGNANLSDILKGLGPKVIKKILGEPKEEKEIETPASRWLRDQKGCEKVRACIPVAGKEADVVGGYSKYYGATKAVYAVELKCRKAGIDRAIGQITTHLEGAHYVYLAISPLVYYQLSEKEYSSLERKLVKNNLGLVVINKSGDIMYELIEAGKSKDIQDEDLKQVMESLGL